MADDPDHMIAATLAAGGAATYDPPALVSRYFEVLDALRAQTAKRREAEREAFKANAIDPAAAQGVKPKPRSGGGGAGGGSQSWMG